MTALETFTGSSDKGTIQIPPKKKTAFVCSGGAAKAGAYHIGVALALKEKGFHFKGGLIEEAKPLRKVSMPKENRGAVPDPKEISVYVGSSAGSIICSFLASGYSLDAIFESFLRKKTKDEDQNYDLLNPITYKRLFALWQDEGPFLGTQTFTGLLKGFALGSYKSILQLGILKRPGLFSTAGIERYLREDVLPSNNFKDYSPELFMVGTQLNHSRKVVFGKYGKLHTREDKNCIYMDDISISHAAAASTSLPPIFAPYALTHSDGRKVYYFDGEIRDTLSTHVAVDAGADLIFASYSHQPYHYSNEIGSLHQYGIPSIMIQTVYLLIERKIQQSRQFHDHTRAAFDAVHEVLKSNHVSEKIRKKCLDTLEEKMNFRRDVDYIHIHPNPRDREMFFGDNFNLNPKKLRDIVKIGFKNTIDTLRRYSFK